MPRSIQQFIDTLFASKPQDKRKQWASYLTDNEYDTVDDLKKISESGWSKLSGLPLKTIEDIREHLSKEIGSLSIQEIRKITQMLNKNIPYKDIVEFMGEKLGTPKGDYMMAEIIRLVRPPLPFPTDRKMIKAKIQGDCLPLFLYQGKQLAMRKYYTLLVIGQTGSGKTTLLDAFVNRLNGMQLTDNWRWRLVNEEHLQHIQYGKSQTRFITPYYINDKENQFNIRIIDSPGLGDTDGIKYDDETIKKFEQAFATITEIDYILLTVKATDTKMRAGAKYIYHRVQQIFGKDAKDRFILMCTFANGGIPNCLQVLQENQIVFKKYFCFDNSFLYIPLEKANSNASFYWNLAMESVDQFKNYVSSSNLPPLSMKQSKEVLETRRYLEQSIKTSQNSFILACQQLDIAKKNLKELKLNKKQIEENGQYTSTYTQPYFDTSYLGKYVQMCQYCKVTCCQQCAWPSNSQKSMCTYFKNGGSCPLCPGKCSRDAHCRTDKLVVMVMKQKTVIIECKKQAYDQGLNGADFYKKQLEKSKAKIIQLVNNVWNFVKDIRKRSDELNKIALQPKVYSDQQFYKEMIKAEEETKKNGWMERVKYLRDTLERLRMCQKMSKSTTVEDLFPELKELKNDCEIY